MNDEQRLKLVKLLGLKDVYHKGRFKFNPPDSDTTVWIDEYGQYTSINTNYKKLPFIFASILDDMLCDRVAQTRTEHEKNVRQAEEILEEIRGDK